MEQLLPEMIFEIALNADFETTIKLLQQYPYFETDDFWKAKCKKQFPTKYYFESWTGKENYLMYVKGRFLLPVCQQIENIIIQKKRKKKCIYDNYIYEYNQLLKEIDFVKNDKSYILYEISTESPFIVVKDNICYGIDEILGQYMTNDSAVNAIKADQLSMDDQFREDLGAEIYYFI